MPNEGAIRFRNDYNPARFRHNDRVQVVNADGSVLNYNKGSVDPDTGLYDTEFKRAYLKIKYPT